MHVLTAIIILAALALVVWIGLAGAVAAYGRDQGFAWWPLFICSVFLSWPLVLLAVTVNSRRVPRR